MKHTELIERLRGVVQKLRRTPMPIADVVPMVNEAADAIESLQAEVERLTPLQFRQAPCHKFCEATAFNIEIKQLRAERDALRPDAERYRHMRNNAAFQSRNGPGLYWYLPRNLHGDKGQQLDTAIDAAIKGAA